MNNYIYLYKYLFFYYFSQLFFFFMKYHSSHLTLKLFQNYKDRKNRQKAKKWLFSRLPLALKIKYKGKILCRTWFYIICSIKMFCHHVNLLWPYLSTGNQKTQEIVKNACFLQKQLNFKALEGRVKNVERCQFFAEVIFLVDITI